VILLGDRIDISFHLARGRIAALVQHVYATAHPQILIDFLRNLRPKPA
jgi:hypothetical protein